MEDGEEPYLAGIKYHAMPPLKRFRDMEHLSGGEKTIAALALLFAIHSYQPSPFFVLDEVDAALDNVNVARVAQYVKEHAGPGMQFIVISLKTGLFQESECLVGVMRDQSENTSRVLTVDVSLDTAYDGYHRNADNPFSSYENTSLLNKHASFSLRGLGLIYEFILGCERFRLDRVFNVLILLWSEQGFLSFCSKLLLLISEFL